MTDHVTAGVGGRARPPVVDDLYTRQLEDKRVVRRFIRRATVADHGDGWVELATESLQRRHARWHFDPEGRRQPPMPDDPIPGRLRVELVASDVVRVRYTPAPVVPDNATPMVVGSLAPPEGASVEVGDEAVLLRSPAAGIEVEAGLRPVRLVVRRHGQLLAEAGGRERNHFGVWDAYSTGVCESDDGRPLAVESFLLRPREGIFGFGEQWGPLNKVGQTIDLNMVEATGVVTPRAYKNIPFWVSTAGYGVFLNHSARITAWVGSLAATDLQVAVEDDFLDYYVFAGSIPEVLDRYTTLTGRGAVPPRWSFGFWQSKISYGSAAETLEVVRRLRDGGFPVDVIHVDTNWFREDWRCDLEFDPERFPDPAAWMVELAAMGVKVSLWQLPYIPEGSALFDELEAAGGFVQREDGSVYDVGISYTPGFRGRVGIIDFTNPAGVEVYQRHLRRLLELGARVIKVDFGEQAPLDGVYHDGTPGYRAHNLYPLLYNRAVAQVTEETTGEHIIWARSAWAGSQRYPLHWGGDSSSNWANLVPQFRGGLSLGLSGFPFWSQDIGGFIGPTGGHLLIRWLQASMFLSHTRIHGTGTRELYAFDDEVQDVGRRVLELRYRMLPTIVGLAHECVGRALPFARALVLGWPGDPTTFGIDDQWTMGEHLMVAPIVDPTGRRQVYLPEGGWRDWWSGERLEGPRWLEVEAPIDRIPLWLADGGVVALGPAMLHVGERPTDEVELVVAPFPDGVDGQTALTVAVDDDLVEVRYTAAGGDHQIEISPPRPDIRWSGRALGDAAVIRP